VLPVQSATFIFETRKEPGLTAVANEHDRK
jgi:hypothetical protein